MFYIASNGYRWYQQKNTLMADEKCAIEKVFFCGRSCSICEGIFAFAPPTAGRKIPPLYGVRIIYCHW